MRVGVFSFLMAMLALALCAGQGARAAPEAREQARGLHREGLDALRAGDLAGADALFLRCRALDPEELRYALDLARARKARYALTHEGYAEARAAFQDFSLLLAAKGQGLDRGAWTGLVDQGSLLLEGGEPRPALEALDRFLEANPEYYELERVHNARGVALFRLFRYEEAAQAFRRAVESAPGYLVPRANLRSVYLRLRLIEQARLQHRMGRLDEALDTATQLLRVAGGCLPLQRLRADILRDLGREEEALCELLAIVAADPQDPITHGVRLDLAEIYEKRGELRLALAMLNQNARLFRNVENDPTMLRVLKLVRRLKENP